MSDDSSATKWIVGCAVAGALCIIVCAGGMFALVGLGFRTQQQVARNMQQAQMEMARQAEETALQGEIMQQASDWSFPDGWTAPPVDALDEALLPLLVGGWERMFQSTEPEIPFVGVEREVRSAVYATDGRTLDLYVCPVSNDERDALFDQVEMTLEDGGQVNMTVRSISGDTRRLYVAGWDGQHACWLVWNGGWLFSFQTDGAESPMADFLTAYFQEIDAGQQLADHADPEAVPEANEADSAAQPVEEELPAKAPAP